jgi:hypothetical protein
VRQRTHALGEQRRVGRGSGGAGGRHAEIIGGRPASLPRNLART